ncbi:hypothetical protein EMIT0P260_70312 [Pseudomonas sp. IT-P260]
MILSLKIKVKRSQPAAAPTEDISSLQDETSVMQLPALRPNVADLAGCSTVAKTVTTPCANQAFT